MRTLLAITLLSVATLSGCIGGDDDEDPVTSAECLEQGLILGNETEGNPVCVEPPFVIEDFEDPDHHCVVNERRDRLHAPDLVGDPWAIGQYWTYDLEVDGNTSTTQMIYYADQDLGGDLPLHYMVGTPTREQALEQAIHSINPVIGRVHSVLYSPHESGDHANMFNFPLCEGSSWKTLFYGETFTLTAARTYPPDDGGLVVDENYRPVELYEGRDIDSGDADRRVDRFTITGTSDEGSTLRIDYDAFVQWFTLIDLDRADGQTVTMDLQETGSGATGDVYFLRGQKDATVELSAQAQGPIAVGPMEAVTFDRADGDGGPYDTIGLSATFSVSGAGNFQLELVAPNGTAMPLFAEGIGMPAGPQHVMFEVPFATGEWAFELTGIAIGADGASAELMAYVVSIYDQSCEVGGDCLA